MTTPTLAPGRTAQPTLFIPHGAGPCFFMDWNPPNTWDRMAAYLRGIAATLPARPSAIVLVSGHWRTKDFSVTAGAHPDLIYDYSGFPPSTYELQYPAAGSPALAERIAVLLSAAGLEAEQNAERGFDHGMFIPLKLMFPNADIPVVQLSLRRDLDPAAHIRAGEALATLRDEGVLIVGSGMSFHNMRGYGDPRYTGPSQAFDAWLTQAVQAEPEQRTRALCDWSQAPHAYHCHPAGQEEHLMPLMVVAGAAGTDRGSKVYSEVVLETQLSAFRFG
ncbi:MULTISPECIES: class III extradiol ring-cleavage dioxygenase [unclassified Bordetella]|uniref:DODA-type extradiol aromatic ring-opening family dioxygenase n=1 Tax=unclassified Bordetella TaxID=2630031 RepID=UPI001325F36D|nr:MULTISPECIES: class III extradiol ring-cleavage dioxygenase [unclassified Bordetella]MVW72375.1 dioxygenase [Bordetella sp. 15P40C-2]MVW79011.1 dioxygenase [Bordetella sp. 02P26C-1]